MALQSSGQISLNDIHVEAGGTTGTQASLNDTDIRDLIGKASGAQSSFSEFYGASAVELVSYHFPNGPQSTADYLYTGSSTDFAFGSSTDFTVEYFWRPAIVNNWQHVIDQNYPNAGVNIWQDTSGKTAPYFTGAYSFTSQYSLSANTWYHIALTRSGTGSNCIKLFHNGTQVYSGGNFTFVTSAIPMRMGSPYSPASYNLQGYMSNFHVVKGTALYTSNFTAPTSPLSLHSNSVLLAMATSTITDDKTNRHTLTKNGTINLSTTVHPF